MFYQADIPCLLNCSASSHEEQCIGEDSREACTYQIGHQCIGCKYLISFLLTSCVVNLLTYIEYIGTTFRRLNAWLLVRNIDLSNQSAFSMACALWMVCS